MRAPSASRYSNVASMERGEALVTSMRAVTVTAFASVSRNRPMRTGRKLTLPHPVRSRQAARRDRGTRHRAASDRARSPPRRRGLGKMHARMPFIGDVDRGPRAGRPGRSRGRSAASGRKVPRLRAGIGPRRAPSQARRRPSAGGRWVPLAWRDHSTSSSRGRLSISITLSSGEMRTRTSWLRSSSNTSGRRISKSRSSTASLSYQMRAARSAISQSRRRERRSPLPPCDRPGRASPRHREWRNHSARSGRSLKPRSGHCRPVKE